jgi:sigma-E factor negative regulatory protein RseC
MKESGKVLRKIDAGLAEVEVRAGSACASCGLCGYARPGIRSMEVKNEIGASVGDMVEIEVPESKVILSSLMIFIFPIFAFFAGYIIRGVISGVVCLAVYLAFLFYYDKKKRVTPRITSIIK